MTLTVTVSLDKPIPYVGTEVEFTKVPLDGVTVTDTVVAIATQRASSTFPLHNVLNIYTEIEE